MADKFKPCSVAGCNGNSHYMSGGARGYCSPHYQRCRKYGDPEAGGVRHYMQPDQCKVDGCDKPPLALGLCNAHHRRLKRHGDPLAGGTPIGAPSEWLGSHVGYTGEDCLIWPFARNKNGYGLIGHSDRHDRSKLASRLMCVMAHGEPPTSKHEAAHNCGNGHLGCANPRHLRWATHSENTADRLAHGRQTRGERHHTSKLTEDGVRRIREMRGNPHAFIAELFGVSRSLIGLVLAGKIWTDVR